MPIYDLSSADAAKIELSDGRDTFVKQLEYNTQADADAAELELQGEGDLNLPLPDGRNKPMTRGEVLYWQKVGRFILILLAQMRGIPIPF